MSHNRCDLFATAEVVSQPDNKEEDVLSISLSSLLRIRRSFELYQLCLSSSHVSPDTIQNAEDATDRSVLGKMWGQ